MRKGISPLVAAVILIAATMSIAGILTYWATGFVRTRLGTVENATEETTCLYAQFKLYSGIFENSTDPDRLYLILENQRSIDLKLESLYLFYPDGTLDQVSLNETILEGNALKSINRNVTNKGFETGRIKTNCPDVSVDFSKSQLTLT